MNVHLYIQRWHNTKSNLQFYCTDEGEKKQGLFQSLFQDKQTFPGEQDG